MTVSNGVRAAREVVCVCARARARVCDCVGVCVCVHTCVCLFQCPCGCVRVSASEHLRGCVRAGNFAAGYVNVRPRAPIRARLSPLLWHGTKPLLGSSPISTCTIIGSDATLICIIDNPARMP